MCFGLHWRQQFAGGPANAGCSSVVDFAHQSETRFTFRQSDHRLLVLRIVTETRWNRARVRTV